MSRGEVQRKVHLTLQDYGERDISATVDEVASKAKLTRDKCYQALYRLAMNGSIELIKTKDNNKEVIIGFRINKYLDRAKALEEQARSHVAAATVGLDTNHISKNYPSIAGYVAKRIAIEEAKETLSSAGVDSSLINFTPDPLAEEALQLLQNLIDKTKELTQVKFDLDAAKKDITYLKARLGQEVKQPLTVGD